MACLQERSSRPHRSPARVRRAGGRRICALRPTDRLEPAAARGRAEVGRPHSTVHQVLRRGGCSRRPAPSGRRSCATSGRAPESCCTWTSRSSGSSTAARARSDRRSDRRSRRVGWEYVHSIVDDCAALAYSEIHDDEQAPTVTAFTRRALDWFLEHGICAERLMTDNAWAYTHNRSLRRCCAPGDRPPPHPALHAPHQRQGRALPADPATRMGLRHGIRLKPGPSGVTATLGRHYNERRTHSALGNRPPTPTRSGRHRAQQLVSRH